ncbi:zinc finger protein 501-like isoform X2 [Physella acuta]|nr:zinc finger protein 501-like isoform X2 [Physella acuta]
MKEKENNSSKNEKPIVVVYRCWICGDEFTEKLGILKHLKKFHNKPELDGIEKKMRIPICLTCGSAETCEHTEGENRDNKIQQQMDEESDDDGDKVSKPRMINCLTCHKVFTLLDTLHQHRQTEHPSEKTFQCNFCPTLFGDRTSLVIHKRDHTGSRPYICTQCGHRFPKSSDLKRHSIIHLGQKPYQCAKCDKTFTQKSSLEKHARIHAKHDGGHPCLLCGLVFKQLSELSDHAVSAHTDVNYKCKTCGKMYVEQRHLLQHEKNHFVVKPYACSFCDRRFSFHPMLVKHEERIHKSRRELACDICNKVFKRTENLNRHKLSHSGVRNHKCTICGLSFTEKGSLTRHTKSQHDQLRPHVCHICGRGFTRKILVRKHIERCHDNKKGEELKEKSQYFKCKLCDKLLRRSGLRHHVKLHRQRGDRWEGVLMDDEVELEKAIVAANTNMLQRGLVKDDCEESLDIKDESLDEEDEFSSE